MRNRQPFPLGRPMCILHFIFTFSFSQLAFSQLSYSDCSSAYAICSLGDFHFDQIGKFGETRDDLEVSNNYFKETNSTWLEFEVSKSGTLEFVIVPDDHSDDYDFILYESNDCAQKINLREMTSGPLIGSKGNACLGQTGLKKGSSDYLESRGCNEFSDNYLAPIYLESSKKYKLLINNFKEKKSGFSILLESSDGLILENLCRKKPLEFSFQLYPSPANSFVNITSTNPTDKPVSLIVYDLLGKKLLQEHFPSFKNTYSINIDHYDPGQYLVRLVKDEEVKILTFIKQ